MTAHIRHNGEFCQTGITLGALKSVTPHTGQDRVPQMSVRFANGVLEMSEVEFDQLFALSVAAKAFVAGIR